MQRRLPTRELNDLRLTLGLDKPVEHELNLLARELEPGLGEVRAGVREAQRAIHVAGGVHLDERQAGVLLVLRAETAVQGTPVPDLGRELERQRPRLVVSGDTR